MCPTYTVSVLRFEMDTRRSGFESEILGWGTNVKGLVRSEKVWRSHYDFDEENVFIRGDGGG